MYQVTPEETNTTDITEETNTTGITEDKPTNMVRCTITKPPPSLPERMYRSQQVNLFFDKIFIINLDRSKDRWKLIVNNLQEHGIYNFERQPGVCLPRNINPRTQLDMSTHGRLEGYGGKFLNDRNYILNCVGTNLAHYQILEKAISRNYQRILVLEDDVFVTRNFNQRFATIGPLLEKSPDQWDLLYLGYKKSRPQFSPVTIPDTGGNLVVPRQFIRGAYGYGLNHTAFSVIQQNYLYGGMEIDAFFEFFMCRHRRAIAVMPPLIGHRDNRVSTITQSKWRGRTSF